MRRLGIVGVCILGTITGCASFINENQIKEWKIDEVIENVRAQLHYADLADRGLGTSLPVTSVELSFNTQISSATSGNAGLEAKVVEAKGAVSRENITGNTVKITLSEPTSEGVDDKLIEFLVDSENKALSNDSDGPSPEDDRLAFAQGINSIRRDILNGLRSDQGGGSFGCTTLDVTLAFTTKESVKVEGGVNFLIFEIGAANTRAGESGTSIKLTFMGGNNCSD